MKSVLVDDLNKLIETIKKNFRRLALQLHPDKNLPTSDRYKFGQLVDAYNNLREGLGINNNDFNSERNGAMAHKYIEDLAKLDIKNVSCSQCDYLDEQNPDDEQLEKVKGCSFTTKYIFFDYECRQESGIHTPNLIVAMDFEGERYVFETNEAFCEWTISKEHSGYTFLAHYSRGYDSYFILNYCLKNTVLPYVIANGSKIMFMSIKSLKIRFIDSHSFIVDTPFSAFPRTFGITEMKKGYFPHFFNTLANENYVGPIPEPKYYGCDTMKPAIREDFLKWHAEQRAANLLYI